MKFTCEINMDNAAFEEAPFETLGDMLRRGLIKLSARGTGKVMLRDINGNTVGYVEIEK